MDFQVRSSNTPTILSKTPDQVYARMSHDLGPISVLARVSIAVTYHTVLKSNVERQVFNQLTPPQYIMEESQGKI